MVTAKARKALAVTLVVGLVATVTLSGCDSEVDSGMVVGKHHDSAYSTLYCASYNPKGGCVVWAPQYHPERWYLNLRSGDKTGYADVDQITFNRYNPGDPYP